MKKEINILFVLHNNDLNNGGTRSLIDVIEKLKLEYKINAFAIHPDKTGTAAIFLEKLNIPTKRIYFTRSFYHHDSSIVKKIIFLIKFLFAKIVEFCCLPYIKNIIKKNNINLIYSNTFATNFGYNISKIFHIKHIWHIREYGYLDHHIKFWLGEHHQLKKLEDHNNTLIFISNSLRQFYCSKITLNNEYVIYDDISKDFYSEKKKEFNLDRPLNICVIGTIQEGKRQLDTIKAVEIMIKSYRKQVYLHIAGNKSGKYFELCEKYVRENSLSKNVFFDGFITDVNSYRALMDVEVVSSQSEAFGRVTIEGMLSRLIVVGSNSAGTNELITNNLNGFLYESCNYQDLANALIKIDSNRNLMWKIANFACEDAYSKFCCGKCADTLYNIIINMYDK